MEQIESNSMHRLDLSKKDSYYLLETLFYENFQKFINSGFNINYFGGMKSDGMTPKRTLTEEEKKIIVTVIQWLGTPVGKEFYNNVIEEYNECKKN